MAVSNTLIPTLTSVGSNNYTITPFQVHKTFNFSESTINTVSGSIYTALFPKFSKYSANKIPFGDGSYTSIKTYNNEDKRIFWLSLQNNFYNNDYDIFHNTINKNRLLYESASVLSLPRKKIGEKIKKNSLSIKENSSTYIDDGKYNIIDTSITTQSIFSQNDLVLYLGFNDKFNYSNRNNNYYNIVKDFSGYDNNGQILGSVGFEAGIPTTGEYVQNSGYACKLNGNGSINVANNENFDFFKDDDFAISFWVNLPNEQENTESHYNYLISKNKSYTTYNYYPESKSYKTVDADEELPKFPFALKSYNQNTSNNGKIIFERKGGTGHSFLQTTTTCTGSYYHIVAQKTGSNLELYVNGIRESQITDKANGNVRNSSDINIGSHGKYDNRISGSIDEVRIYRRALTIDEIGYLSSNDYNSGSAYQTRNIGNIFYENGLVCITDPRPKYKNSLLSSYDVTYKSTLTLYQHEIICKVKSGQFNLTTNPTIRQNDSDEDDRLKGFVTGSFWKPYITTIGLYNDDGELVAVAKTGQPVQKRDDVDMNFIVKFDM